VSYTGSWEPLVFNSNILLNKVHHLIIYFYSLYKTDFVLEKYLINLKKCLEYKLVN